MCFFCVLCRIWSGNVKVFDPSDFKQVIEKFAPRFAGYSQQDSQELLLFLLDGLHEDLNRFTLEDVTNAAVQQSSDCVDDLMLAEKAWSTYKLRNNSIIISYFHFQIRSVIVCPDCSYRSVTFDPIMYLSLPLEEKDQVAFYVMANDDCVAFSMLLTVKAATTVCDVISRIKLDIHIHTLLVLSKWSVVVEAVLEEKNWNELIGSFDDKRLILYNFAYLFT